MNAPIRPGTARRLGLHCPDWRVAVTAEFERALARATLVAGVSVAEASIGVQHLGELLREAERASDGVNPGRPPQFHFERIRNWPRHEDKL